MMRSCRKIARVVVLGGLVAVTTAAARPAMLPVPSEVQYFPGDYFRREGRLAFDWFVLLHWPGPAHLVELWRSGRLDEHERVALLLGGAAFHDPALLPLYRAALDDPDGRIREAAAFGFRDLVAAPLPVVEEGVTPAVARRFKWELAAVGRQLEKRSLTGFWLDRLRAPETASSGVYRHAAAIRALDAILRPEDEPELIRGFQKLVSRQDRRALLPLMEAMICRRLIVMPRGQRSGWGPYVYDFALQSLEHWMGSRCDFRPEPVLRADLARYGMNTVDPMSSQACSVWLEVLRRGRPFEWALASRQLYRCGGPPAFISMLRPGSKLARRQRVRILHWFGQPTRGVRRRRGPR